MNPALQSGSVKFGFKIASRRTKMKYVWAYLFILPQAVFFLGFTLYPVVMSYVYSFFDWSGIGPLKNFVGFQNFVAVVNDSYFHSAFLHSIVYMLGHILLALPLTFLMALVLNQEVLKGRVFYRTIYFLPVVTTTAIVGIIMTYIFGNQNSVVNDVLMGLGILRHPVPWLGGPSTAMFVLILVGTWKSFGMTLVYWLAGMQSLPLEVYEAAKVDGAGFWRSMRDITIPLILPVAAVILLLSVVNGLHVFDLVKTLTNGGPFFATETVDLYIYRYAFDSGIPRIGYASAAGILFGVTVFILTIGLGGIVRIVRNRYAIRESGGE